MRERIKWIIVGFGFMVGIQVVTSLMLIGLIQVAERTPGSLQEWSLSLAIYGLALSAFLIGGFVIGRVNEQLRFIDALVAAIATLAFSALVYLLLPEGSRGLFPGSIWLSEAGGRWAFAWVSALSVVVALAVAALGSYLGYLMTMPVESLIERLLAVLGVIGAIGGPVVLLVAGGLGLPWYLLILGPVILLACVGLGYWMFARESHRAEDISIRPEPHHRQQ